MNVQSQFDRYAKIMAALPAITNNTVMPSSLMMASDGRYQVSYAPFDHVTLTAKLVLVGITPGLQQARVAVDSARLALLAGKSNQEAAAIAKKTASFVGPTRKNLIALLDYVGTNKALNITSTASLWAQDSDLVNFTSALRYPVFFNGKNYGGSGLVRSAFLREQLEAYFGAECRALPNALYVPLGDAATEACNYLATRGVLAADRIIAGLPHPSPANAERIAYWLGEKAREKLSVKTSPDKLDAGRDMALHRMAVWA